MRLITGRGLGLLLAAVLVVGAQGVWAQTWKAGKNVTATLKSGTLTVSGRGDMTIEKYTGSEYDHGDEYTYVSAPWNKLTVKRVVVGSGITSIGERAFAGCVGLTSVTIPNSVISIGVGVFAGCTGLTSITIPNSVTSIGNGAFEFCTGLTSIAIPNSVISIGENAFRGCTGLTSINIPDSVTSIESSAFGFCTGLTSITIPNSVTSIGESAFRGCTGLTSITIPDNVTSIERDAFYDCIGLTSVTIGNGVTSLNGFKFACNLTTVVIGNSVTIIDEGVFAGCTGLMSITIPNNVKYIGDRAFEGCTGLTSVTIPDGVTSIGNQAFSQCTSLTYIIVKNQIPLQKQMGSFGGLNTAKICLIVPSGSVDAYRSASSWKTFTCIKEMDQNAPEQVEQLIREAEQTAIRKRQEDEQRAEQRREEAEKNASYFTDKRDGNKYKTVVIGNKTWMAENLNYGTGGRSNLKSLAKDPNNGTAYRKKYGKLYNWETAETICPAGWRLPSLQEWDDLIAMAGGEKVAGKVLKSKNGWAVNGTDEYGFSALPGGFETDNDTYLHIGGDGAIGCWWWTDGNLLCIGARSYCETGIYKNDVNNVFGASVRCVQK
jgi:uncharacterized protein (TIGR02145 family)